MAVKISLSLKDRDKRISVRESSTVLFVVFQRVTERQVAYGCSQGILLLQCDVHLVARRNLGSYSISIPKRS
jgi:hypothetical protein